MKTLFFITLFVISFGSYASGDPHDRCFGSQGGCCLYSDIECNESWGCECKPEHEIGKWAIIRNARQADDVLLKDGDHIYFRNFNGKVTCNTERAINECRSDKLSCTTDDDCCSGNCYEMHWNKKLCQPRGFQE